MESILIMTQINYAELYSMHTWYQHIYLKLLGIYNQSTDL